ncbi:hypothetical protein [Succinimonas amylolytica]|uniref:hypothetical protein n=1 Tax=Succinimonas amylolytica TaxID=83769 RepID=UPI0023A8F30C
MFNDTEQGRMPRIGRFRACVSAGEPWKSSSGISGIIALQRTEFSDTPWCALPDYAFPYADGRQVLRFSNDSETEGDLFIILAFKPIYTPKGFVSVF